MFALVVVFALLILPLDRLLIEVVVVDGVVAPVVSVVGKGDTVLVVVELVTLVSVASGNSVVVD